MTDHDAHDAAAHDRHWRRLQETGVQSVRVLDAAIEEPSHAE